MKLKKKPEFLEEINFWLKFACCEKSAIKMAKGMLSIEMKQRRRDKKARPIVKYKIFDLSEQL